MIANIFNVKFILLLTILLATSCHKSVESRRNSPLLVEDDGARRNSRPAVSECQFGKALKELGSTWFADLGPPFGVMYCIKCECVAIPKKRRIVARVQCRNIKSECPPIICDDPILLPGKCCKICPENFSEHISQPKDYPAQVNLEEEERNFKYFAALLTGRTSMFLKHEQMKSMYTINNPLNIVATARFSFYKKNLYYSFYLSKNMVRPRAIQFIDSQGNILEEHNLMTLLNGFLSNYQNSTGKICGVWRRIPRDYKRLLRDEKLFVVLLWDRKFQSELALAGRIGTYISLSTESFSSLLEPSLESLPEHMNGAGGTAIVSTTSGVASSVHLTIIFNGLFGPEDVEDVPINVKIEVPERKDIVFNETRKIKKPSSEINFLEISTPISLPNLRLLGRGKLILTVQSRRYPNLNLQGHIVTRTTCELFQTLLTPTTNDSTSKISTSGLAWAFLNTDGSLVYNIKTNDLNVEERPNITLIEENGKKKGILEDLSNNFNYNQAIGTIDKLGPRVLEALYSGFAGVNIRLQNNTELIRGNFTARLIADSRDSADPILLKNWIPSLQKYDTVNSFMGMAWIAIDNECNLHYEVTINSNPNKDNSTYKIYLEEKPIEAIGAPISRKLLQEFSGNYVEGFFLNMPYSELFKLESSVCYLEIHPQNLKDVILRGKLKSTKVPSHCYPIFTDNNVPNVNIVPNDHRENVFLTHERKCFHSGRFYDEAEQWRSVREVCTMCTCQYGRVSCDTIKCPTPKCKSSENLIIREKECCATCISTVLFDNTTKRNTNNSVSGCRLGNEFYLPGASWHPYLPPNGFDVCTTCKCNASTLKVQCPRIICPKLQCPEKIAYRPNKKACCKECPDIKSNYQHDENFINNNNNNNNYLRDEGSIKTKLIKSQEILAHGGCKVINEMYENGQEWHPIIASHGEQKCVDCRCKDGKVTCSRKKCSRLLCNNKYNFKYISRNYNNTNNTYTVHNNNNFEKNTNNKTDNISNYYYDNDSNKNINYSKNNSNSYIENYRSITKRKGVRKDISNKNEMDECCSAIQCRRDRKNLGPRKLNRDKDGKNSFNTTNQTIIHSKRS